MIKSKKPAQAILLTCALFILVLFGFVQISLVQKNTFTPLVENPFQGGQVFFQKGCIQCHTIWGIGDPFGPDLTQIGYEKNFFQLAGALWSHSPKMIEVMKEKDITMPVLAPKEIEELMSYLYYLGIFDELGDYLKGEEIFSRKGCVQCHSIGEDKKKTGPSLDKYGQYVSPVFIAAALWNHSSSINQVMFEQSFAPQEMSHLLAYIKGNALNTKGEIVYMEPGNPKKGQEVFEKKKCGVCHVKSAQDLSKSQLRKSLTELVGMIWNHSFQMWQSMKEEGLQIPHFDDREMADLMAYLYFIPYYGEKGDSIKGKKIFTEKGCNFCHSKEAVKKEKGIDLAEVAQFSFSELISAMWNHVPQMESVVTELNLAWPRFEKNEMKDLISYIQSLK